MVKPADRSREGERLHKQSANIRADSLRIQIMAVDAFCSVAEVQLRWYSLEEARTTAAKIRRAMSEIDFHLREPGHVSGPAAQELRDRYIKLSARVRQIENSIHQT